MEANYAVLVDGKITVHYNESYNRKSKVQDIDYIEPTIVGQYIIGECENLVFITNIHTGVEDILGFARSIIGSNVISFSDNVIGLVYVSKQTIAFIAVVNILTKSVIIQYPITDAKYYLICKESKHCLLRFESSVVKLTHHGKISEIYAPKCILIGFKTILNQQGSSFDVCDLNNNVLWSFTYSGNRGKAKYVCTHFVCFELPYLMQIIVFSDKTIATIDLGLELCNLTPVCDNYVLMQREHKIIKIDRTGISTIPGKFYYSMENTDYIVISTEHSILEVRDKYTFDVDCSPLLSLIKYPDSVVFRIGKSERMEIQMTGIIIALLHMPIELTNIIVNYL